MPEALLSPPSTVASQGSGSAFELVCACCATNPGRERIARIASWQYAGFNWEEFFHLAEHHGVLALAARHLLDHAPELPPHITSALESAYAANFRRGLWFAAELMRVTQHFAKKQLRAIPYKGPVLAQSAYGDLALRSFSDLDLLISPADFARAKEALAQIGYQPSKQLTPAVERLWLKTGYESSFDGPGGKNLLELQWAILPYFYAVDPMPAEFRFDDLWARGGRIALGADNLSDAISDTISDNVSAGVSDLPCLSPEDSLLVISLHAAKHLWTRLLWVTDIAESVSMPGLDLPLVLERARRLGIARILGVSFWLAEHLLGTVIPSTARAAMNGDPEIPILGQECIVRLARAATYDFESAEYFRQILRLRERRSDRLQYLWRLTWTPGPGDIDARSLPEFMFPLYRAVRIARLLGKLVRG